MTVCEELHARYTEPWRAYHNLAHVEDCLEVLYLEVDFDEWLDVEVAILFHDVVYTGQESQIETVGAQLVLAGPSVDERLLRGGGPAAGLQAERQPIPRSYKATLANAIGIKEALDPALPGERVGLATARQDVMPVNPAPLVSVATAVLLLALAGFFFVLSRAPKPGQS